MHYSIGIDLGGTKIEAILMDKKARILNRYRRPTEAHSPKEKVLSNIVEAIDKVKTKNVIGVGIGHPGFSMNRKLTSINNIPCLKGIDLAKELQEQTGLKTVAENDANCFAIAEHRFGAAKGSSNVVALIIGTGIGAGIIISSRLYKGSHGGAGEIGYLRVGSTTFEESCSGPNIVKRYKKAGGSLRNPNPSDIFLSKEAAAKKVTEETIDGFARGFAGIINAYDPEMIIVGGGVSKAFSIFMPKVIKVLPKYATNKNAALVKIVKNKIGEDAGVVGAALLPLQN